MIQKENVIYTLVYFHLTHISEIENLGLLSHCNNQDHSLIRGVFIDVIWYIRQKFLVSLN